MAPHATSHLERLLTKITFHGDTGCWLWKANVSRGYARISVGGVTEMVHRLTYKWLVGPIPEGLPLDHLCHNADASCPGGETCPHRRCLNPAHLEPVTHRENILRGRGIGALNAAKTHCPRGHPLEGENLYVPPNGDRLCRTCRRARDAARKHARS